MKENNELYSNTEKKNKACENHTLEELELKGKTFKYIINLMEKIEDKIIIPDKDKKTIYSLFFMIRCFIENYSNLLCYNSKKSIENFKKFLEKIYESKNGHFQLEEHKESFIHLIKITSEEEFAEKMHNFKSLYSVQIINKNKDIDLSVLRKGRHVFPKMKELILRGNKIEDISFFLNCEFPNLEKIDLEDNIINNACIQVLLRSKLPKLKHLNLYKNQITNIKIFEVVKHFKELEVFYIGENKFNMKIIKKNKSFFEFPKTVEEFGLTGNFNGNANFAKRLGLENLKIFYINRNKISNLKCLKNIKFNRLGEFWAISNNITDIKEIMNIKGKDNIWKINLKQNKINNFKELLNIIQYFPKLKELILVDNGISKKEAKDMTKKIKKQYKMDLKIEV